MESLGFLLALCIGVSLGLMGSGGSILTVPVFVYILQVEPSLSTTYSLFAIGVAAAIGSIRNYRLKLIAYQKIIDFGIPSIILVFLTRQFILPLIPKVFFIGPWVIHQNTILMVFFSLVMLLSALKMIQPSEKRTAVNDRKPSRYTTILQGAGVGLITGIVGAGGGFLIIPALIGFYKMPMHRAVGTSLAIICINSFFGMAGDIEKIPLFDWKILAPYTVLLLLGMFLGFYISRYFNGQQLKRSLGYLILGIAIFIFLKETLL